LALFTVHPSRPAGQQCHKKKCYFESQQLIIPDGVFNHTTRPFVGFGRNREAVELEK
jgi:hypothetical protein